MDQHYQAEAPRDVSPVEALLDSIQHSLERLAQQVDRTEKTFVLLLMPAPASRREDGSNLEVVGSPITHRLKSFDVQINGLINHLDEILNRSEL